MAANGESHAVAAAPQAANILETLESHALLAPQVTLEGEVFSSTTKLLHVGVAEILHPDIRVDSSLGQKFLGTGQADAIHIGEGNFDPLVARDINTGNPSHVGERFRGQGLAPRWGAVKPISGRN